MYNDIAVLIIEDEDIWAKKIAYDMKSFGYHVAGQAGDVDSALHILSTCQYDLVLLDINLHGKNSGLQLGKLISGTYKKPFIFITGSLDQQIMHDAALARPSAYLTKPVASASLFVSMQSAIHHFNNNDTAALPQAAQQDNETYFFVKNGPKYKKIDWRDVVCLRSEKTYTSIVTSDGTAHLIRSSLQKTYQYIIPDVLKGNFVQINRAEILNIHFIDELIHDEIIIEDKSFTITTSYLKNLKEQLKMVS